MIQFAMENKNQQQYRRALIHFTYRIPKCAKKRNDNNLNTATSIQTLAQKCMDNLRVSDSFVHFHVFVIDHLHTLTITK